MSSRAIAVFGLLLCLAAQIEAGTIKIRWAGAQHKLSASLPRSRGYYFNAAEKYMKVCSGDKVLFYWGAEKLNMFMFDSRREYDQCSRKNLNFLKNYQTHTTFSTLGNNSGDRYYAFIPSEDGGKGSGCVVKLRVSWGNC